MKYVVRVVETGMEGGIVGRYAWLALSETEMQAMVDACSSKLCGLTTEVLHVTEPNQFVKERIAECMPTSEAALTGVGELPF